MSSLSFKKFTGIDSNPINKWNHDLVKSLNKLIKEVGRQPDYIVNQPNGLVCYNNPTPWIIEHVLRDEYVKHCVPKDHIDYLYTTVKIYVPPNKVPDVQSISGSVLLDLLKNTVSARCGSTGANYATLRTVIDVIMGNHTREEISQMYKTNLSNIWNDFDSNKEKIRKYVTTHPVKELQYHPFAFPEGCNKESMEAFSKIMSVPAPIKQNTFGKLSKSSNVKYIPNKKKIIENLSKSKDVNYIPNKKKEKER